MNAYRTLLMPIGLGGQLAERITGALAVAKHFQAHLDVLFIHPSARELLPEEFVGLPKAILDNLTLSANQHASDEAQERQKLFMDLCQQQGVPVVDTPSGEGSVSAAWLEANGVPMAVVAQRGRLADLIVMPQPSRSGPSTMVEAALTETGRPGLLMPRTQQTFTASNIVVGWNGSAESAGAVHAAIPCLAAAGAVTVVTSTDLKDKPPSAAALQNYLAWHGVKSELQLLDTRNRSAGEALLEVASARGAELLVMGGYGYRRMRELVMGSVTGHVLAATKLPVLMAH